VNVDIGCRNLPKKEKTQKKKTKKRKGRKKGRRLGRKGGAGERRRLLLL